MSHAIPEPALFPDARKAIETAIETGIQHGLNKAHKHNDNPTRGELVACLEQAIMSEVWEWFPMREEGKVTL